METISKAASAASKAIWGESQASSEEPVSGKMGNVAAGEPYDAGNMGNPKDAAEASTPSKEEEEEATTATRTTGTVASEPMPKPEPEAATKPRFVDEQPTPTTATPADTTTVVIDDPAGPAKSAPSAHGMRGDSTEAQNDTRPPPDSASSTTAGAEPPNQSRRTHDRSISPKTVERGDNSDDNNNNNNNNNNNHGRNNENADEEAGASRAINLQGPGPRPLEQVARERGGDAGAVASEPESGHQRRDSGKGLGADDEEEGPPGAGIKYVRSSGLAADGGDFDASRPGAGKEADRLLEQKGVHRGAPGGSHRHGHETTAAGHGASGGQEKHSLKDRIKAKIHRGGTSA